MTTLRKAAQQALEALGSSPYPQPRQMAAIAALKAALAEPDYWEEEARRYASNANYWRKRCVSCGGALPATGQDDRTGECVCGEPTALNTVHRKDGPCYMTEPVAWIYQNTNTDRKYLVWRKSNGGRNWQPLFTAPPQRKPLPASDIVTMYDEHPMGDSDMIEFARAIEQAHGIKS